MDDTDPTDRKPVLTLHHGGNTATFAKHPIATARRALLDAAIAEQDETWALLMRQFASSIERRATRSTRRERARSLPPSPQATIAARTREAARALTDLAEVMPSDDVLLRSVDLLAATLRARALSRPRRGDVVRGGDIGQPTPDPFASNATNAADLERARESVRRWQRERDEIEDIWKRTPTERREGMLLQALGDERLTITELRLRLNAELLGAEGKRPRGRHAAVYDSNVRALVMRMHRAGQLKRAPETFRNKVRYRYGAA